VRIYAAAECALVSCIYYIARWKQQSHSSRCSQSALIPLSCCFSSNNYARILYIEAIGDSNSLGGVINTSGTATYHSSQVYFCAEFSKHCSDDLLLERRFFIFGGFLKPMRQIARAIFFDVNFCSFQFSVYIVESQQLMDDS
jgi:hypothetical protein